MAFNTKFSREEVKKIGIRLHAARVMTGQNREEFAEQLEIPAASIKNWELGRVLPREDAVISMLDTLNKSGVFVSKEWVLLGSGMGPNYIETTTFEQQENLDEIVTQQLNLFKKTQRVRGLNPIVITVEDSSMAPTYLVGDLIGGVIVSNELVKKELCATNSIKTPWLVTTDGGQFAPVFVYFSGNKWFINTHTSLELHECSFPCFAKIKWHYSHGEQI